MVMDYKIEVIMTYDEEMVFTPYCWCVLKRNEQGWHNCGHGWSTVPEEAWRQAYNHYRMITKI